MGLLYRGQYTRIWVLHWLLDASALMFHKYVCTCIHTYVYKYIYMCVCTYVFMHVFGCVCVCVYNPLALGR